MTEDYIKLRHCEVVQSKMCAVENLVENHANITRLAIIDALIQAIYTVRGGSENAEGIVKQIIELQKAKGY